ncbi:MAG: filamentous hemagglutinin N-terminal domain-containing protein [Heteroscytonema crispum UTEX LB 1556]
MKLPSPLLWISSLAVWCFVATSPIQAQITPDGTLPTNSQVTTSGNLNVITGGTQAQGNLFHSFELFSVPTGTTAYFNNANNIQNIIGRVTGKSFSNIDGLIRANGTANLFLLNPNGILFGANARLDIGGSFVASTANSLKFADLTEFTTIPSQTAPLLTISTPIGLQVGGGTVVNAGNLTVNSGQNLTLLATNVFNTGQLKAPGGEVNLAAVPGVGFAGLAENGSVLSLQVQGDRQPLQDSSFTELLARADIPGFAVNGGEVKLAGIAVPNQAGTAVTTGNVDVSNSDPNQSGGTVKILGDNVGLYPGALVNASGDRTGGNVLLGGDFQGKGELLKAAATYVSPTATIAANALTGGNGGKIVVWSDNSTRVYGTLQARGGVQFGNGGLIETSSLNGMDVAGITIDASANTGIGGTWLLDPRNVILNYSETANGDFNNGNPNIFTPTGDDAAVDISDIQNQLNAGTNVFISTGSTGTQEGNISADGFSITKTTASPVTLKLQAANNISLKNFGINSNSGFLNMILESAKGNIDISSGNIQTAGGEFTATAAGRISLNGAGINSDNNSPNNAAPINLTASAIALESAGINTNAFANGNAAAININGKTLTLTGAGINSKTQGVGNAGNINMQVNSLFLKDGGINSDTSGNGNAGNITINANTVDLKKVGIGSTAFNSGNAGLISINTDIFSLGSITPTGDGSGINSNTFGSGNAGGVSIKASAIAFEKGGIGSNTFGSGDAGNVNVTANSISLLRDSGINSNTTGKGQAGAINLKTSTLLVQNQSGIGSNAKATGNAGAVNINADAIELNNKGGISSNTQGEGNAGTVTIKTGSLVIKNNSGLDSTAESVTSKGNAGEINITADSIIIKDGGGLATNTEGQGNAGNITIKTDSLSILGENSGLASDARENSTGNGGSINITADLLFGESVSIAGNGILSETRSSGNAGEIKIKVNNLVLRNGSNISTSTFSKDATGNAGRIEVTANSVLFENDIPGVNSGGGAVTRGRGRGGEIILKADRVIFRNRGGIGISSEDIGNAGKLTLIANSLVMENTGISSSGNNSGKGGEIDIEVNSASLNNSSINTNAFGASEGGIINIKTDSLLLAKNSNLNSNTFGSGRGGNINLNINGELNVRDRSNISVSSNVASGNTQPGRAGDIQISARSIKLDNESKLIAATASGDGGEIQLRLQDLLLLRRHSQISTTAGNNQAGGNGGNITINTPFIVAIPSENSDISANAFTGAGGKVDITTQGIFGILFRPRPTNKSDITASSEFGVNGVVTINTPDLDPSRGLIPLPANLVDASQLIAQGCNSQGKETAGSFIATGRGGIPTSPIEPLIGDDAIANWIELNPEMENRASSSNLSNASFKSPNSHKIVEAQGWIVDANGDVILVAQAPTVNLLGPWLLPTSCHAP